MTLWVTFSDADDHPSNLRISTRKAIAWRIERASGGLIDKFTAPDSGCGTESVSALSNASLRVAILHF